MSIDTKLVNSILQFWFDTHAEKHYVKSDEFDTLILSTFKDSIHSIRKGELDFWKNDPTSNLAGLVLLDQFSRNVFRESPKAFAQDQRARSFAKVGIARGYDMEFEGLKRTLFYMPLMHSEYLDDQFMCEACFERYLNEGAAVEGGLEYATKHRIIVEKYGHFPHRNKVLGRHSSDEEIEFLKGPGSSF